MKKIHYSLLGLLAMFLITSSAIKPEDSKTLFEKVVFVELTLDQDSMLFKPYSKAWKERWNYSSDIKVNGSYLMNSEKYKFAFKDRNDNLWTILHPMIIDGSIQSYSPYDPATFGLGKSDDGELRYPISNQEKNETFLTSEKVRENMSYLLGMFGPEPDFPLVDDYGDPLTKTGEDGELVFVYPPPDYIWFEDKDIVKYRVRMSIFVNKKGKEKKRVIQAISPIVHNFHDTGEIQGDRELVWLNFQDLESTLDEAYFFDENMIPITYLEYFQQQLDEADFDENE